MDLQADQTIDDVHALAFQRPRPLDIALLIEARLQLDQHGDLLAFLHRLQQRFDDGRVPAHAVQRHLDRQHVGIVRGLANEIDHRLERIERMVQQHVLPPDEREDVLVLGFGINARGTAGTNGASFRSGRSI